MNGTVGALLGECLKKSRFRAFAYETTKNSRFRLRFEYFVAELVTIWSGIDNLETASKQSPYV